ncbi:MAG: hypothetical protein QW041_00415 [Candidatus Pacearchaeota archaeon]
MTNVNIREKIEEGWIRCIVIIEVLGKPAEYLDKVLKKAIEELEKEKNIIVIEKKFNEPKPIEKMFSTFTELELLIKDMHTLTEFVFAYMPSNIEIIEPNDIKFELVSANEFINKLIARIHQYDAIAKRIGFENKLLKHKLEELGELPEEIKEMDKILEETRKKAEKEAKEK